MICGPKNLHVVKKQHVSKGIKGGGGGPMGLGRQDKKLGAGLGAPTTKLQNDRSVSWIHCLTMQLVLTSPALLLLVSITLGDSCWLPTQ